MVQKEWRFFYIRIIDCFKEEEKQQTETLLNIVICQLN